MDDPIDYEIYASNLIQSDVNKVKGGIFTIWIIMHSNIQRFM